MLNTLKNLLNPTTPAVYLQNLNKTAIKPSIITKPSDSIKVDNQNEIGSTLNTKNQLKSVNLIMVTVQNNNNFFQNYQYKS